MSEATVSELLFRPATELAAMVRAGDVSARELVETSLERIESLDRKVNAFVEVDADGALASADLIGPGDERPFAGVPIATKDLFDVAGLRLSFGSNLFGDYAPQQDAAFVRRLRDAGFVIVGMTSTPEFGILPTTEPVRYGATRNPWDLERTCGGSSGGAGAAVAAGMVPIAQGSDGGGSIRIPAACCGLVGLKTSRNRVSMAPAQGEHLTTVVFGLTRTIADTAALLDVMAGAEWGDAAPAPPVPGGFAVYAGQHPEPQRIAVTATAPIEADVDPLHLQTLQETAELLASLGHEVAEWTPPWTSPEILSLFTVHFATGCAYHFVEAAQLLGREATAEDCEPLTWELRKLATETFTALDYFSARTRLQQAGGEIVRAVADAGFDAVLTPSLAQRPVPIGTITGGGPDPMQNFAAAGRFTPFTALANVTGQPAISLPIAHGDDGLPIGVQLIGPPLGEGVLLSLGAQLEAARPWADRHPTL